MMTYWLCFVVGYMTKVLLDEFLIHREESNSVDT